MDLSDLRRDFGKDAGHKINWPDQPFPLFHSWLKKVISTGNSEANAMVLSTCGNNGIPSSRVVLLKEYSETGGFVFYTNFDSRKGIALRENPYASLHFFWRETEQQVSIEGKVEKVSREKSDAYFNSRPIESRISAVVSPQSKVIENTNELNKHWELLRTSGIEINRPANWGGYRLLPERIEFWQGRQHRLHERMVYYKVSGNWLKKRLAP